MSTITQVQGVTPSELVKELSELLKPELTELFEKAIAHQSSEEDYLNAKEVLQLLKISYATLWRKETEGLIKFTKIGAKKLYKKSDIIELLHK